MKPASFWNWIGPPWRRSRRRPGHRPQPRPRARPTVEVLEDRTVPSTFTVRNLNDSGPDSLRQAVLAANANAGADLITFDVSGTITLTSGQMILTDDLTINGDGRITVSGNNASRIFQVQGATTDVAINDLTLINGFAAEPGIFGSAGGAIQNISGHLTLARVTMANNQAFASLESGGVATAGAIDSFSGASLVVRHSRFIGNKATGAILSAGGALLVEGALTVTDSQFIGNQATTLIGTGPLNPFQGTAVGGAISVGPGSTASISHSHFTANVARGGNGIVMPGIADGNGGIGAAGAIFCNPISPTATGSTTLSVDHSTFWVNQALGGTGAPGGAGGLGAGGAIGTLFRITARITHSEFVSNEALGGAGGAGAVGNPGGPGGRAHGGALGNPGGAVTVEQSTFTTNTARGGDGGAGGAGANGSTGGAGVGGAVGSETHPAAPGILPTTMISGSTFTANTAQGGVGGSGGAGGNGGPGGVGEGGALENLFGTMTVTTSVVAANRATGGAGGVRGSGGLDGNGGNGFGGGLVNALGGTLTVSSTPVLANWATGGAGAAGGGAGGHGQGGGVWVGAGTTVTIRDSPVTGNRALGGAAGTGGSAGQGRGGGIYVTAGATVKVDRYTLTHIVGNHAFTSNDDVFGILVLL
jgi:hypothetical protein